MDLLLPYAASILADYTDFAPDGDSVNFKSDYLMRQIRATTFRGPVTILYKGPGDELAGVLKAKTILMKYKCFDRERPKQSESIILRRKIGSRGIERSEQPMNARSSIMSGF